MKPQSPYQPISLDNQTIVLTGSTSWYLFKFREGTIRELKSHGARVVCIAPEDEASERLVGELDTEFIPWKLDHNSANPFTELLSFYQVLRVIRQLKPDFVFNFAAKPNFYTGIACRLLRVPYANNVAGLGMEIGSGSWLSKIISFLYGLSNRGAARVFVQNPDDLELLREKGLIGEAPVTELPGSGVDLDRFNAQELPPPPPTFVMIARLQADKGVREFVTAAKHIHIQHPEARFILVGPTEYTNRSAIPQEELRAWQAEAVVEIPGAAEDVRPWLTAAHAVILPSHGGEGTPRIILEAAASARPAIVSDVPGCRHAVIDGQTGFVHPPRDEIALARMMEKIITMSNDELGDMARAARAHAEDCFSERLVINAYLACL